MGNFFSRNPSHALRASRRRKMLRGMLGWLGAALLVFPGARRTGTAHQLGALYLDQYPQEADRARLWALLAGDAIRPLERVLENRIARDWREHDVAVLAGWVFARTEGRMFAYLHLTHGGQA